MLVTWTPLLAIALVNAAFTLTIATLVRDRTREKQRVEKLLEDTQIKLSSGNHLLQLGPAEDGRHRAGHDGGHGHDGSHGHDGGYGHGHERH